MVCSSTTGTAVVEATRPVVASAVSGCSCTLCTASVGGAAHGVGGGGNTVRGSASVGATGAVTKVAIGVESSGEVGADAAPG